MTTRRQTVGQQDRNRGVTGYEVSAFGSASHTNDKDHAGYANDKSLRTDGYVGAGEVVFQRKGSSSYIRLYEIVEEVEILADGTRVTRLRYRLPDGSVASSPGGEVTPSSVCLRTPYTGPGERCTTKHQVTYGGSTYELEEAVDPYQSDGRVLVNIRCISGACKQTST